jgi:hypothetical protein
LNGKPEEISSEVSAVLDEIHQGAEWKSTSLPIRRARPS